MLRPVTVDAVREELEASAGTHFYIEGALAVLREEIPVITPSVSAEKLEEQLLGPWNGFPPGREFDRPELTEHADVTRRTVSNDTDSPTGVKLIE